MTESGKSPKKPRKKRKNKEKVSKSRKKHLGGNRKMINEVGPYVF